MPKNFLYDYVVLIEEDTKMPGLKFHVSRSISPPNISAEISKQLDFPGGMVELGMDIHMQWRAVTHNIETAALIGYMIGGDWRAVKDAVQHVYDDLVFNKIFYGPNSEFRRGQMEEYEGKEGE